MLARMRSFLFVMRVVFAWVLVLVLVMFLWRAFTGRNPGEIFGLIIPITLIVAIVRSASHVHRVGLIAERVDSSTLANRHRRRIEIPYPAAEAFDIVEAAIRELPNVEMIDTARDSLQVRARVLLRHRDAYFAKPGSAAPTRSRRNLVIATVTPGGATSSLTLVCEPEMSAWRDWIQVDQGTNLENCEAITRAISRRIAERRKGEETLVRESKTEKELTAAKLSLLHAQVEPHFLYNTLASTQILTRSDPARADQMLSHLITYLRQSVPRAEDAMATLGNELERARAYLEILKIRMGERLTLRVEVPEPLKGVAMPPMMLQTLVENAIKHGLEPVTGGGTIWILAREVDGKVAVTVADDGRGFSEVGGGTGIGLKNVRERLKLAYGDKASFSIGANFPKGVAATITIPSSTPVRGGGP
jgi:signal transduction histidine kinase